MLKFGAVVLVLCGLVLRHVNAVVTCTATCTATSMSWDSCNPDGNTFATIRFVSNPGEAACRRDFNAGVFTGGKLESTFPACGVTIGADTKVTCDARLYVGGTYNAATDVTIPCPCTVDANGNPVIAGTQSLTVDVTVNLASLTGTGNAAMPLLVNMRIEDDAGQVGDTFTLGAAITSKVDSPVGSGVLCGITKELTLSDAADSTKAPLSCISTRCGVENADLMDQTKKQQPRVDRADDQTVLTIIAQGCKATSFIGGGTTISVVQTVILGTTADHPMCAEQPQCPPPAPTGRKRRAASGEGFFTVERNVTISIQTEDPRQKENAGCEGYVSSTIFYVTVIVLAVLLVVTIGVAALFGTRARAVVLTGKDNPVYG